MIIFSDLHLQEKSQDVALEVLRRIPAVCKEHGDNHVAFLGDFWMIRHKLDVKLALKAHDIMASWDVSEFDVLVGNHDQVDTAGRNALELFAGLPFTTRIHTDPGWTKDGFWLPYRHTHDEVEAVLSGVASADRSNPPVCFAHLGIKGSMMNNAHADEDGVGDALFSDAGFKRVFLGHYHRHQKIRKGMMYVGSPYQVSYSEAGQAKGYIHWDGKVATFHEWDIGPKHHKFVVDADNPESFHVSGVNEGDKVWVLVKGQMAGAMRDVVSRQLESAGLRADRIEADLQPAAQVSRMSRSAGDTLDDLAARFVEGQEIDNAFKERLSTTWEALRWDTRR